MLLGKKLFGMWQFIELVYRFTKTYPDYPVVRASNFFHR